MCSKKEPFVLKNKAISRFSSHTCVWGWDSCSLISISSTLADTRIWLKNTWTIYKSSTVEFITTFLKYIYMQCIFATHTHIQSLAIYNVVQLSFFQLVQEGEKRNVYWSLLYNFDNVKNALRSRILDKRTALVKRGPFLPYIWINKFYTVLRIICNSKIFIVWRSTFIPIVINCRTKFQWIRFFSSFPNCFCEIQGQLNIRVRSACDVECIVLFFSRCVPPYIGHLFPSGYLAISRLIFHFSDPIWSSGQ